MWKAARDEGIDRLMDTHKLDAIMAATGAPAWKTDLVDGDHFIGGSSSLAAIAGYPSITLPMGFIDELPVGVSFFGRAWSEPVLIGDRLCLRTGDQAPPGAEIPGFRLNEQAEKIYHSRRCSICRLEKNSARVAWPLYWPG